MVGLVGIYWVYKDLFKWRGGFGNLWICCFFCLGMCGWFVDGLFLIGFLCWFRFLYWLCVFCGFFWNYWVMEWGGWILLYNFEVIVFVL